MNADGGAELRTWKIVVNGASGVASGPIMVSSQLANLTIASPYRRAWRSRPPASSRARRSTWRSRSPRPWISPARRQVTLIGLPNKVTTDVKKITKDTTDLLFHIKTDKVSPAGNHASLFCQVVITQNGEPIVHNIGTGALRIDVPLPPKANAPAPGGEGRGRPSPPRLPAAKPLIAARKAAAGEPNRRKQASEAVTEREPGDGTVVAGACALDEVSRRRRTPVAMRIASILDHAAVLVCLADDCSALAGSASSGDGDAAGACRPHVFATPTPRRRLTNVAVYPAEINLTTARDRQSIVVQATYRRRHHPRRDRRGNA